MKFRIGYHKLMIETGRLSDIIKSLVLIDFVLLVDLIKLKMKCTSTLHHLLNFYDGFCVCKTGVTEEVAI